MPGVSYGLSVYAHLFWPISKFLSSVILYTVDHANSSLTNWNIAASNIFFVVVVLYSSKDNLVSE